MSKKLFFALSLMTILAIGCTKSDEPHNQTGGGNDEGGNTPGQVGGIYSETFAGYSGKVDSGYLANESFTSTATGVTWTLDFGKIDQTEDHEAFYEGHCFTMGGKAGTADSGQSVISTSVLSDGITHLEFDYIANKDKKLEVQVLVGSKTVWTSGTLTLENNGTTKSLEHKSFTITGAGSNAVVKFINISEARRISIGNITWTNATGQGGNGKIFESGSGSGEGDEGGEGEGGESGEDEIYTSLTSDITVADINYAGAEYYGDDFDFGTNDWCFYMGNDDEELCFELFTELNATTPVGSYTIDLDYSGAKGTAWEGYYSDLGIMPGYYNYSTDDYAYPASGTITISNSDSNYTVTVAVFDELGHKISASYSGAMTIKEGEWEEEESDAYATVKSAGKAILKSHKAHKDVKAVKVSKSVKSGKAANGKRAHKAKAIRIAR